jgi:large subunit ribosomal protein L29
MKVVKIMKTNEIRKLSTEEINKKIAESKEELFNLRMKQATGSLENPSRIRELRKTVARLKTILREREIEG